MIMKFNFTSVLDFNLLYLQIHYSCEEPPSLNPNSVPVSSPLLAPAPVIPVLEFL